jgi:ketosteroid isomerase-like protein
MTNILNLMMKESLMKHFRLVVAFILFALLAGSTFAGDKEDVMASLSKTIEAFNKHEVKTYFSTFVDDNTEFPYVVSPLRHNADMWKKFIEGTTSLAYVNYHQQDSEVQIYNGDAAIVTGYYTFSWMENGGQMNYQSGRASIVLVKQNGKWMTAHMHFSKMF